jgi:hypothetical protein
VYSLFKQSYIYIHFFFENGGDQMPCLSLSAVVIIAHKHLHVHIFEQQIP